MARTLLLLACVLVCVNNAAAWGLLHPWGLPVTDKKGPLTLDVKTTSWYGKHKVEESFSYPPKKDDKGMGKDMDDGNNDNSTSSAGTSSTSSAKTNDDALPTLNNDPSNNENEDTSNDDNSNRGAGSVAGSVGGRGGGRGGRGLKRL